MIILSDLHIGAIRSGGATPASAAALRRFALDQFKRLLDATNEDLCILGDLFDTHTVLMQDLLDTYDLLQQWTLKGHALTMLPGNHDLSTDSSRLSSFQALGRLLPQCRYIQGSGWVDESQGVYATSHVPNQDLLDIELAKVPPCKFLLLHANYDNNFAAQSDHSLNVSAKQAQESPAETLVFAHEHAPRKSGKAFVMGNNFPMSVSDCLDGNPKYYHSIRNSILERHQNWSNESLFKELDWKNLYDVPQPFIRITGKATAEQGADVANAVAKYRRASTAFVVSSAVKVGEDRQGETVAQTLEDLRGVNVMELLREYVTPEEMTILENLK